MHTLRVTTAIALAACSSPPSDASLDAAVPADARDVDGPGLDATAPDAGPSVPVTGPFSPPSPLAATGYRPELSADGLTLYTVDLNNSSTGRILEAKRLSPTDGFGSFVPLAFSTASDSSPSISHDGLVMYFLRDGRLSRVARASLTAPFTGLTDESAGLPLAGGTILDSVSLVGDTTLAVSVWSPGEKLYVQLFTRTGPGATWQPSSRIDDPEHDVGAPELSFDGGTLYYQRYDFRFHAYSFPMQLVFGGTAAPVVGIGEGEDLTLTADQRTVVFYFDSSLRTAQR